MPNFLSKHRKLLTILFIVLIFLLTIYLAILYFGASILTKPQSTRLDASPKLISNNYESIEFKTSDNLTLRGNLFKSYSDKLIIMVGGLIPNRFDYFYFTPTISKELLAKGYNVLIYDTRAHGISDGQRVGFGSVEGKDVVAAVNFAKSRGFNPAKIGLVGNSTGGISIIMVIDQLKDVGAIVVDSVTSDFSQVVRNRITAEGHLPVFLQDSVLFAVKTLYGLDLDNIKPIDKITLDPNRNFLFLHSEKDQTIPIDDAKILFAKANKASKFVVFKDFSHIESYRSNPELYRQEVYSFLDRELDK